MKNLFRFAFLSVAAVLTTVAQSGIGTNCWGIIYEPKLPSKFEK